MPNQCFVTREFIQVCCDRNQTHGALAEIWLITVYGAFAQGLLSSKEFTLGYRFVVFSADLVLIDSIYIIQGYVTGIGLLPDT